ncbi:MAG: methyltransferase domain-containing protein [Acidobacteriota bacterium]
MTAATVTQHYTTEERARQSLGGSEHAIYEMVGATLARRQLKGETLVDVGCGTGHLRSFVRSCCERYLGVDVVRYEGFPADAEFFRVDLDSGQAPFPDHSAELVVSVETIEHLENPRAFMRELTRLAKPGGWVVITTPNQLSLLSLLTLLIKRRFSAFQDVHYPAHITALLEVDLLRIAAECGLREVELAYSLNGRVIFTPWHYPKFLARTFPRVLSDNLLLIGRKPLVI